MDCTKISEIATSAVQEARALGHNYVGTEHLVLALCRTADEVVVSLFRMFEITPERFRPTLLKVLHDSRLNC
jgi:ATP-dependent Clp protease ATP-binding subunit ClpC